MGDIDTHGDQVMDLSGAGGKVPPTGVVTHLGVMTMQFYADMCPLAVAVQKAVVPGASAAWARLGR